MFLIRKVLTFSIADLLSSKNSSFFEMSSELIYIIQIILNSYTDNFIYRVKQTNQLFDEHNLP